MLLFIKKKIKNVVDAIFNHKTFAIIERRLKLYTKYLLRLWWYWDKGYLNILFLNVEAFFLHVIFKHILFIFFCVIFKTKTFVIIERRIMSLRIYWGYGDIEKQTHTMKRKWGSNANVHYKLII